MSNPNFVKPGFDVGNVILRNDTDQEVETALAGLALGACIENVPKREAEFLERPQSYVDGALETVAKAVETFSSSNAFIISKCGLRMQQKTLDFFEETDFYDQTGFDPANVLFCKRRSDKAPIAETLGLTHFTDDRLDILRRMTAVRVRMLFQRVDKPPMPLDILQGQSAGIRVARNWDDVWQAMNDVE